MPRKQNGLPTQTLRLSTTAKVVELLEELVATGLHGKNPTEAAERLISEKLREMIAARQLSVRENQGKAI
jgi:hypothetical protein